MQHPDVDAIHLYDEEAVLVAHPRNEFAISGMASMREVAREPLILYGPGDPGSSYSTFISELCREAGVTPKPESTEGGRLVSILKWPEGALLNLG